MRSRSAVVVLTLARTQSANSRGTKRATIDLKRGESVELSVHDLIGPSPELEDMMRVIRRFVVLLVLVLVAIFAFNYWTGNGWTLRPPATSATGVDAEKAREKGGDLARTAAERTKAAAERTGAVMTEAAITAKIKSKMALDDYVKARTINVATSGTIVSLTGTVRSEQERERAVRLARETDGVTQVVDRLHVGR